MKRHVLLILLFISLFKYTYSQKLAVYRINNQSVINSGNITRSLLPDSSVINLFQGNGKFGCSYGPLGLHLNSSRLSKYGNTQYMHLEHRVRAKFGADYLIPLARIYWKEEPLKVNNYKQYQSFYDGTITTHFENDENKTTVTTWFDPIDQDLTGGKIEVNGSASDIVVDPFEKLDVHYGQKLAQVSKIEQSSDSWKIELTCLDTRSFIFLKTDADVQVLGTKLILKLHQGINEFLISVNHPVAINSSQSLKQSIDWWHSKWDQVGLLVLPDLHAQQMWIRSMALLLSTYSNGQFGISTPNGFTGNGWPFDFPQDLSYIHPVFLATGNLDIAKSWIEYWARQVSGMKEYTKRLLKVDGILCPWVFPYGDFKGFHNPTPPNECYYELHNSGYLARMAYETAILVNDENWTKENVLPLIKEIAMFYKNIVHKGTDGLWHISIKPSMGQDEMGGLNQDDYLCALFSAKYCFQKALELHLDADGSFQKILTEGLAFPTLKSKRGYYFSCKGSGEKDFGNQKHPVQLNDLAYLPINTQPDPTSLTAYNLRYEITQNAKKPFFHGWTLGEFLLAGSRVGNVEEWKKDWNNLRKSDYVDPDWIQVYETSGTHGSSFYNTTSGLIAQSLLNNIVSDWFGKLEIAKCNPWKGKIFVRNIYSLLGVKIDGEINNDAATLFLTAWKNAEFELFGEKIKMEKNKKIKINLNLKERQITMMAKM